MDKIKKLHTFMFILYCAMALLLTPSNTLAKYDKQPKIQTAKGDLVLEPAYDRNISFRLSRDSSFMLNGVDIMEKIRQRYTPFVLDPSDNRSPNVHSSQEITNEVQTLQDDLGALLQRFSLMENRTRNRALRADIRRGLARLRRLIGRVSVLEDNMSKDECAGTVEHCKNGGSCYDSYNGFHCECREGWTGNTCEDDEDECYILAGTELGCQNNAVCINTPGEYRCNCAKGFAGTHCRLRSAVCQQYQSQELCGHGICVPANNPQGYTCICDQGWTRNATANANSTASLMCMMDKNECDESNNPCHSECINLPGGFKCGPCPAGYSGNGVICMDVDECLNNNGGCSLLPKVRCINTEGSYRCGNCPVGWVGDGHTCELAPTTSCDAEKICHPQAKCEYISDIATCTCNHGMFGHGFGPDGCHTNPINDSCESHICKNNGTCISKGRSTSCICPLGYSGALCETADGCHPNPCDNQGTCTPLANQSFKCSCSRGTTGKKCEVIRSVCGSIQRWPSGELSYPSDGSPQYAPFERCAWIVRTNPSNILNVTFTSFDVEEDTDCTHDWLQVHDGHSLASQLIGRFCGHELPLGGNIVSSQHQLFFWFRSDNVTNRPGFHMKWESQPHICGDSMEVGFQAEGIIRSPGYPGKTPANRECQWELTAPFGYRFVIRVYEINVGSLQNCTGDTLKIYDADLLLKEFCRSATPQPIRSSSNKIKIHFHADSFGTDSSFQLHYEVQSAVPHCGGAYTDASGLIVGPIDAPICLYIIQQPKGAQIKLEFTELELFGEDNCYLKSIEVFDGSTDDDELLAAICNGNKPSAVTSSSNFILIRYRNLLQNQIRKPLFKAKYTRVCEFRFFGPDAGEFSTPNYPKPYADKITCTFHIYGPTESVVHANFTDFSIAEIMTNQNKTITVDLADESNTYVDVYFSESNKIRYSKGAPMELISELNKMTIVFHADINPTLARGFRVEYSFQSIPCGGVYTESNGSFGKRPFSSVDCQYIFEAPEGKDVHISFGMVSNEARSHLLIYANVTGGKGYLLKNISNMNYFDETLHYNVITMFVPSDLFLVETEYEFVDRKKECGGNFSTLYGVIKSRRWPLTYAADLDCIWIITAPLGYKVELTVQNFTLEENCDTDFLEIRNGMFANSPLIGRYCGSEIPSRLSSFSNSLYLRFTSDDSIEYPGFHIIWEQTESGCGGKLTSYKGSIHSPTVDNGEDDTNLNLTCDWTIHVSQGSSVVINVVASYDTLAFCRSNRLKIYDGSMASRPLLRFNCSETQKSGRISVTSSSNDVLVVYTLSSESRPEFILDYETNCRMVLDHVRGVIESPNFPELYPELLRCNWDINAGANNKLKLAFSHLSLEAENMECEYDFIEVLDMRNEDILQTYRLCTEIPAPISSEGDRLVVRFQTDYSNSKDGFRAEYSRVGCGELLTNEYGSVQSPNYPYSIHLDCDWYIEVPAGKQIVFTILELKIDTDAPNCSTDELLAKEYKNATHSLFKQCTTQETSSVITTPTNQLYINFRSGPTRTRKYFKAMYHTKDGFCGGAYRGSSGVITSPNYPQNLTQEYHCKWEISVPEFYRTVLNFKEFEISQSPNCSDAYLKVYQISGDTQTLLNKYCGSDRPDNSVSHSGRLGIEYMNKGPQSWGKFALQFGKQCGGIVADGSGFLKSHVGESCLWMINGTEGSIISINILQMDCFCRKDDKLEPGACSNFVEFIDDKSLKLKLCNDHTSNIVFEKTFLRVYANNINFRAKYSTIQHSCGGLITSPRGSVASPYYPATYPPNIECTWSIYVAKGNSLQLEIVEFDVFRSDHCNEDYLEISTVAKNKILGLFCGKELPDDIITTYEAVWIRFRSSSGSTGKGFRLNWRYGHSNEIGNDTYGVIESPPIALARYEEEPFTWRILMGRENYISLNFEKYIYGLNLYDGFDETALPVTIEASPWRFVSSSNVVFLKTDNDNLQYFSIKWNITTIKVIDSNATLSKCHTEHSIKSQSRAVVTSPGYPNGYEPNLRCDWIFKPARTIEHVVCEVYVAKLEVTSSCYADYLEIATSADLIQWHTMQKLCNSSNASYKPFLVLHGTPNIKLDFVTDGSINGTGFSVILKSQCGSNLTDSVGVIHGESLMPETTCLWQIQVKRTKRINLQFDFAPTIPGNAYECLEYALIYDGVDEHAPLMPPGKICNPQNVSRLLLNSTSNYATIKYNLSLPRPLMPKRWNLTYREYSECNEEYRLIPEAEAINISSPNYPNLPQPFTECEWRVVAPPGELIQVEFLDRFDMNSRFCSKEYLEFFDGSTTLSRSMGRFCRKPSVLRTTQNIISMRYQTDIAEPRSGFRASISISKCGASYSNTNGVISSPGYPGPGAYPSSTECDYVISLPNDATIHLEATDIHLPFNRLNPRSSDYLEIISAGVETEPILIFGNTTKGSIFDLNANKAIVRFHTFAKNTEFRGFSLSYHRFGGLCMQDVSADSGFLTLHFPKRSYSSTFCRWKITVPKGQRVRLEFLNLNDLKEQNSTKIPILDIYNDHDMVSRLTTFDVNHYDPSSVILSTDNIMLVRIHCPLVNFQFKTIRARYSSNDESPCPANIDDDSQSGLIDIQNTQPLFDGDYYCFLKVKLSGKETLVFNITSFENSRNASAPKIYAPLTFRDQTITSYWENLTQVLQPHAQVSGYVRILQFEHEHVHKLRMDYRRHKCGGYYLVVSDLDFEAPTPVYSGYGAIMCVWILQRPFWSGHVDSEFKLSGNFTFSDNCDREFVLIKKDNLKGTEPLIKICRDNVDLLKNYTLTNRLTFIVYQSQDYRAETTKLSMQIRKSIVCGSQIKVAQVTGIVDITRESYRNNQECAWEFATFPGFYLQLQFFGRFFIEDSPNCTKDYLEVQNFDNGVWFPEAHICGRVFPDTVNVSTSRIRVLWHTDEAVTADGFSFIARSHCFTKRNVTTTVQQLVTPTGFGYGGRNAQCEYIFQSNETDKLINVRVKLSSGTFFKTDQCRSSGFFVYKLDENGAEKIAERVCDLEFEESAYKFLRLKFVSAYVAQFTMYYGFDTCGGNITTSPATIRPLKNEEKNHYAHNMNCVWHVTAPPDHSIVVRFKYFDTEHNFDYVSIYSGATIHVDRRQAKLSGNLTSNLPTVLVDHNQAVINAVSDATSSSVGFEAQIVFLHNCNERISLTDGNSPVILSRTFKLNGEEEYMCVYRVTAPKGHRIRIDIKKLSVNNSTSGCANSQSNCQDNCTAIEVEDSAATQQAIMGRFCSLPVSNVSLISSYEDAKLKFDAKLMGVYNFEISLSIEKSACGQLAEYKLGEREVYKFVFPQNGESSYAPNMHCTWRFKSDHWLQIHFNFIDLQNTSLVTGKCLDYIEIKGKYSSTQLCGYSSNFSTTADRHPDNDADITFHSDATVQGKGVEFVIQRANSCNQTYHQLSGIIRYENSYEPEGLCVDRIIVPENYTLNVYVANMYFRDFDCRKLHFRITDLKTNKTLLDQCHRANTNTDVFTTTNTLRLEAMDFTTISLFYTASDKSRQTGCGGILKTSEGYLSNPPYDNDRNFSECRWDIIVPAPNTISVNFYAFNMGASTNCPLDNVQLIDVLLDGTEKMIKMFCGAESPRLISSTSNHIAIISKKSPNFDGTGWNLHYHISKTYTGY